MAYSGAGAGTIGNPYQITTIAQFKEMASATAAYWKLMNNLDFTAEVNFFLNAFYGNFDGNGKELQNLQTGYGWLLKNGCTVSNLIVRATRAGSNGQSQIFYNNIGTYSNVTISNLHVIFTGTAVNYIFFQDNFDNTCLIDGLIIEGNVRRIVVGTVNCIIRHVKVLHTVKWTVTFSGPEIVTVLGATGVMEYCQNVIPLVEVVNPVINMKFLVGTANNGSIIRKSFVYSNILITYTSASSYFCGGFTAGVAGTIIEDCYSTGTININNGVSGSNKSGYVIECGTNNYTIQRCFHTGNIITPLNDNRRVFYQNTANYCYYNKDKITGMTPVDVANQQVGLTTSQVADSANYTTWDFINTWQITPDGPILKDNPLYAFETDFRVLSVTSVTRNSSSQFTIVLNPNGLSDTFGLEITLDGNIVYDVTNVLNNTLTVSNTVDGNYTYKPYWLTNGIKSYAPTGTYFHYCQDSALIKTDVAQTQIVTLNGTFPASYVHGSCLYNGKLYGSTRNSNQVITGNITSIPINDYSSYVITPIYPTSSTSQYCTFNMEQMVECGGYLWTCTNNTMVVKFDPTTNDYQIFALGINVGTAPIITDGEYLYFTSQTIIIKVNPADFSSSYPKWNEDPVHTIIATYTINSQGQGQSLGYPPEYRGYSHAACADSEYLYVAFVSQYGTDPNGYSITYGVNCHELHKINKTTMIGAGYTIIPKATDDMCQTTTHLFFGCEVQPNSHVNTYGRTWGAYSVRKSDLHVLGLPRLHSFDDPFTNQSYASLIFGNYLLDSRTNKYIYILDISDVDNWSPTEPIGKRTLKCYNITNNTHGGVPNELLLDDNGNFNAFIWGNPSGAMQFNLSGLNFFAVPTIETLTPTIINKNATLGGYILNTGGKEITSKGFKYGTSINQLSTTVLNTDNTTTFTSLVSNLAPGTYYYRAFAINSEGESNATIEMFTVEGTLVYFGTIKIDKIMLGSQQIIII